MPRERSPARDKAKEMYLKVKGKIVLKDIASELGVLDTQIRKWKSTDKWDEELKGTLPIKKRNVTIEKDTLSWITLENEYITDIRKKPCTLENLSEKHNIAVGTIEKYSMDNKWSEKRKRYKETVKQKTVEKISEKVSGKEADRNARVLNISDMALDAIEEYFANGHYKKHVYKEKTYVLGKVTDEDLVTIDLTVADTKALSNMVSSLDKIQKDQRLAEGLDKETSKVDIVKESNTKISTLASLINNPVEDRKVQDFEDDEQKE